MSIIQFNTRTEKIPNMFVKSNTFQILINFCPECADGRTKGTKRAKPNKLDQALLYNTVVFIPTQAVYDG